MTKEQAIAIAVAEVDEGDVVEGGGEICNTISPSGGDCVSAGINVASNDNNADEPGPDV